MPKTKQFPVVDGHKTCTQCLLTKPEELFDRAAGQSDGRNTKCKACRSEAKKVSLAANPVTPERRRQHVREYKERHPDRVKKQDRKQNLRKFGLTLEEYEEMLVGQGGVCAVCRKPPSGRSLAVDHDHLTGRVRGLLCARCNTALGLLNDSPLTLRAATEYLETQC